MLLMIVMIIMTIVTATKEHSRSLKVAGQGPAVRSTPYVCIIVTTAIMITTIYGINEPTSWIGTPLGKPLVALHLKNYPTFYAT